MVNRGLQEPRHAGHGFNIIPHILQRMGWLKVAVVSLYKNQATQPRYLLGGMNGKILPGQDQRGFSIFLQ